MEKIILITMIILSYPIIGVKVYIYLGVLKAKAKFLDDLVQNYGVPIMKMIDKEEKTDITIMYNTLKFVFKYGLIISFLVSPISLIIYIINIFIEDCFKLKKVEKLKTEEAKNNLTIITKKDIENANTKLIQQYEEIDKNLENLTD